MVAGSENFKEWFAYHSDQFAVTGAASTASRKLDAISLPEDAVLPSISLDDDHYQLLLSGKHAVDSAPIVGAEQLILFKARHGSISPAARIWIRTRI